METRILKTKDSNRKDVLIEAAKCIDAGGLVVFPTETVYGIAARAENDTLAKLDKVKGRSADKRYTLHLDSAKRLADYVPQIPLPAAKLIKKFWPGPLTIVLELTDKQINTQAKKVSSELLEILYKDNSIGFRCPDNSIACELLSNCTWPIVAPSANCSGNEPATNAADAAKELNGLVDIIIDAGKCEHKQSSSVVKLSSNGYKILRDAAIPQDELIKNMTIGILFVCTGNTCRSPIAEGIAKKTIAKKLNCSVDQLCKMGYKVGSAGIAAGQGSNASLESIRCCESKNIDISDHKSRQLSAELLDENDYIFVMCQSHLDAIIHIWPHAASCCTLLDNTGDLADPIGGGQEIYNKAGSDIERAVVKRISELIK